MAAKGDSEVWQAARAVLKRHGADARAFATERLAFCRSVDFADGVALWSDILEKLTILLAHGPSSED